MDAYKDIIDRFNQFIHDGKVFLVDLSQREFREHFVNSKRMHEAIANYWNSFALNFHQISSAEISEISCTSVPLSEKLTMVFQKLYNSSEDVGIDQFISAFVAVVSKN